MWLGVGTGAIVSAVGEGVLVLAEDVMVPQRPPRGGEASAPGPGPACARLLPARDGVTALDGAVGAQRLESRAPRGTTTEDLR